MSEQVVRAAGPVTPRGLQFGRVDSRRTLLALAVLAGPAGRFATAAGPAPVPAEGSGPGEQRGTGRPPAWHSRFELGLADWRGLGPAWGRDNLSWHEDAEVPGRVLRVRLHAGGIDPGSMARRGLPRSGAGFKARVLDGGAEQATLRYRVRFAPGFEFVRGGKLPGLFGGSGPSGGRIPDGHDGFSLRLMWREQGRGEVYAYLPTSRVHGSSLLAGRLRFVPGRWHEVVQAVALNTPGQADGRMALWQDGQALGQAEGLRLRDSARLRIDGVFFEVFHGGADDSWAPRRDGHVDFADFVLEPQWPPAPREAPR